MRIGFDLDGVLYDWHLAAYDYAVEFLGIKLDINTFFLDSPEHGFTEIFWKNLTRIPFLYTKFGIKKELYNMLVELAKDNELFYITHRPDEAKESTRKWAERCNLPFAENIIFTKNKSVEIRKNNIKLFIDDDHRVIQKLDKICTTIFVSTPWRKEYKKTFDNYVDHTLDLPEKIKEMIC